MIIFEVKYHVNLCTITRMLLLFLEASFYYLVLLFFCLSIQLASHFSLDVTYGSPMPLDVQQMSLGSGCPSYLHLTRLMPGGGLSSRRSLRILPSSPDSE